MLTQISKFKGIMIYMCVALCTPLSAGENQLSHLYRQLGLSDQISYKADMEMSVGAGESLGMTAKIYFQKGAVRTEGEFSSVKFITILKTDGTLYSFNEAIGFWMKSRLPDMDSTKFPQVEKIGKEELDGVTCLKYRTSDPGTGQKGFIWVAEDLIYRMEMDTPEGKTSVQYKNITKGELDDALFSPPSDAVVQEMGSLPTRGS